MEKKKRKKVCPKCGRNLWLREYYRNKDGTIYPRCKECVRKEMKERYLKTRGDLAEGVQYKGSRLMERHGKRLTTRWSSYMIEILKRKFPNTKNEDLALELNVCLRVMSRKAAELGLVKSKEFTSLVAKENSRMGNLMKKLKNR